MARRSGDPAPSAFHPPPELAGIDLADMRLRVFRFAFSRTNHEEDSEDLASRALESLLSPSTSRWDPQTDLFVHLCAKVAGFLGNDRRLKRRRRQSSLDDETLDTAAAAPSSRDPDRLVDEKRQADLFARRWAALRAEMAHDPDCLAVMDQTELGTDDPSEQAAALGIPAPRIYNANKRIRRAAQAIAEKIPQ